jgi:hypothetical protein
MQDELEDFSGCEFEDNFHSKCPKIAWRKFAFENIGLVSQVLGGEALPPTPIDPAWIQIQMHKFLQANFWRIWRPFSIPILIPEVKSLIIITMCTLNFLSFLHPDKTFWMNYFLCNTI